jgi:hypothetical protein
MRIALALLIRFFYHKLNSSYIVFHDQHKFRQGQIISQIIQKTHHLG